MHRGTVITIGVIAAVAALVYFYVEKRSCQNISRTLWRTLRVTELLLQIRTAH